MMTEETRPMNDKCHMCGAPIKREPDLNWPGASLYRTSLNPVPEGKFFCGAKCALEYFYP